MKTITIKSNVNIEFSINLSLTLGEAQALEAIVGYGIDPFLEVFYKLGKAYLEPHEEGMKELFKKVWSELPTEIAKIQSAQKAINEALLKFK
jgi:hypothetical protein